MLPAEVMVAEDAVRAAMVADAEWAEDGVPVPVWAAAMNAEWAEVTASAEWAKVAVVAEAMVGAVE